MIAPWYDERQAAPNPSTRVQPALDPYHPESYLEFSRAAVPVHKAPEERAIRSRPVEARQLLCRVARSGASLRSKRNRDLNG